MATVRLRLPTFFCAPNFSFLMVADAYDAVSAVPGVTRADVTLADHHASAEINGGVAAQAGFVRTFAGSDQGEAVAELDELRLEFFRKAGSGYGGAGRVMAQHSLGDTKASQAELDAEIARYAHGGAYQIAVAYAWRGEADKAFEWLERSYQSHDGGLSYLVYDRMLHSLHSDPRYAALLKKLNLPVPPN